MENIPSPFDEIAFGIVELNVSMPLSEYENMTTAHPLYAALIRAWKNKVKREQYNAALVCAVVANCMGGGKKTYQPKDFMPSDGAPEDKEADIKANFLKYQATVAGANTPAGR